VDYETWTIFRCSRCGVSALGWAEEIVHLRRCLPIDVDAVQVVAVADVREAARRSGYDRLAATLRLATG
jgi:hypothetical protein